MLKDVPGQLYESGVLTNFNLNFGQLCVKMVRTALTERMLKPLHHDQYSCSFVKTEIPHPSS